MSLANICVIIDAECFYIQGHQRIRELGFSSLTQERNGSYRFDLSQYVQKMNNKEWKTANYCKKRIHGLTIQPLAGERYCMNEKEIDSIIINLYKKNYTDKQYLVAFKGGHIENDKLDKLKIPFINLESFGCPKYKELPTPAIYDCGYHIPIPNVQCPIKKSFAFKTWVQQQLANEL